MHREFVYLNLYGEIIIRRINIAYLLPKIYFHGASQQVEKTILPVSSSLCRHFVQRTVPPLPSPWSSGPQQRAHDQTALRLQDLPMRAPSHAFGEIDQTELCTFYGVYSSPPRLTVCDL